MHQNADTGANPVRIESINAVTIATADMAAAAAFYSGLGFEPVGAQAGGGFATFRVGTQYFNITAEKDGYEPRWWGRIIFHVSDVDAMYRRLVAAGIAVQFAPRDAPWGERYFHVTDPDGHELSFARPIGS